MRIPSSLLWTLASALAVLSLVLATDKPATKRILVLCTGNSARSQMAAAFLKSFDARLQVYSAGTAPAARINPHAVQVMREVGIDISGGTSLIYQIRQPEGAKVDTQLAESPLLGPVTK